jgi:cellulose biosynthesis protein BcsQ
VLNPTHRGPAPLVYVRNQPIGYVALEHVADVVHCLARDALDKLEGQYDRIYIDTPPNFNFYSKAALLA